MILETSKIKTRIILFALLDLRKTFIKSYIVKKSEIAKVLKANVLFFAEEKLDYVSLLNFQ